MYICPSQGWLRNSHPHTSKYIAKGHQRHLDEPYQPKPISVYTKPYHFYSCFSNFCTNFAHYIYNCKQQDMSLKCGIVGLPNVGKSTLFNCLSSAKAQAANFPFCTIEPNVGVITVPDERLRDSPRLYTLAELCPLHAKS